MTRPNPHQEASWLLGEEIARWQNLPREILVERLLGKTETSLVVGESGKAYQVAIQGFWDDKKQRILRVIVAIDDSGWRSVAPITDDFLIGPEGSIE